MVLMEAAVLILLVGRKGSSYEGNKPVTQVCRWLVHMKGAAHILGLAGELVLIMAAGLIARLAGGWFL